MSVTICPADLVADCGEVLAVLGRNLDDVPHAKRFKWLYHDNPGGHAWSWLAREVGSGQVVGVASLFPRAVWLGSRVVRCGQVGDFAVDVTHRTLGPAMMLQRATFEPVQRGEITFCYDCPPHERGMSTFRRLGMTTTTIMHRHAKLLRVERQLRSRLGASRIWALVAPVGNTWLRLGVRKAHSAPGLEVDVHRGRFGEEFTRLDERVGGGGSIRGRRAAEDLNWRYREDPLNEYEVFTARRRGELLGFVVIRIYGEDAVIVDLFGDQEAGDWRVVLLEAAAARLRDTTVQSLHASISEESSLVDALRVVGFRLRQRGPHVVSYATPSGGSLGVEGQGVRWDFVHADVMA